MLRPAQLYQDELQEEICSTWYNPKYFFYGWTGDNIPSLPDNNYDRHDFVSVDDDDFVIGYISYDVNWAAMSVCHFGIISFDIESITFGKDVYKAICDLFEVYHMNRISWEAYADNPAIKSYRRFIKKHGGRECGYYRQVAKLQDGQLHDSVSFEILASEFKK